ncbi:MAG: ArsR family transcriptional regulator [Candidatus Hodarchaeota archaeon]
MGNEENFDELKKLLDQQQYQIQQLQEELDNIKTNRKEITIRSSGSSFSGVEQFGEVIGNYIEGILTSVQDSVEGVLDGVFRLGDKIDQKEDRLQRKAARVLRKRERFLKKWGLSPEDYDKFYEEGAKLTSSLADINRLKLLKLLEGGPKYQKELSEDADIHGGSFKHHMGQLREEGFVDQEVVRGRYYITQLGREALKLSEILWLRKTKMEKEASKNNMVKENQNQKKEIESEEE